MSSGRSFDVDALVEAGFRKRFTDAQWKSQNERLADSEMATGGPYVIEYALENDYGVVVTVEQNTATQDFGEITAQVTYPPVAIVEGPRGRVAVDSSDTDLILAMAQSVL